MLLETLYHSFDEIANRRGVFKVETVGDCCKYFACFHISYTRDSDKYNLLSFRCGRQWTTGPLQGPVRFCFFLSFLLCCLSLTRNFQQCCCDGQICPGLYE